MKAENMYITNEIFDDSKRIYNHLMDDTSKQIFEKRFMYSLTGNSQYIQDMIVDFCDGERFLNLIRSKKNRFLWGAGFWGKELACVWGNTEGGWSGFVDNNPKLWGSCINGLRVYPPSELPDDATIFIASRWKWKEIKKELVAKGISESNIVNVGEMIEEMANKAYFDLPALSHCEEEVFVDVGAFDGMTSVCFANWAKRFKKIYCLEAALENVDKCKKNLASYIERCVIIPKAAWSKATKVGFINNGEPCDGVDMLSDNEVETVKIDDVLGTSIKATFIKMDIEGSELEALHGCTETIRNSKPKLAICIYHKNEDIFEILKFILEINPEYKLYLRHYSLGRSDTICYAV